MTVDVSLSDEELINLYNSKNYFLGEEYSNYIKDRRILEKNLGGVIITEAVKAG